MWTEEEKKAFVNDVRESLPRIIDTIHDPTLQRILALKGKALLGNLELIPTKKKDETKQ